MRSVAIPTATVLAVMFLVAVTATPLRAEQVRDKRLLQKASVDAEQVPFKELLEQLGSKHKLAIQLHESVAAVGATDVPITMKVEGVSLQSLLKLLCEATLAELVWRVDKAGVTVLSWEEHEKTMTEQPYSLAGLGPLLNDPNELQFVLEECTTGPWESIHGVGGGIVSQDARSMRIRQTTAMHEELAELFAGLSGAVSGRSSPPSIIDAANGRVRLALNRAVPPPPAESTLAEGLEQLLAGAKLPHAVHHSVADEGIDITQSVDWPQERRPLQAQLAAVLEPLKLAILIESEAVKIVSQARFEERKTVRVYDVRKQLSPTTSVDDLIDRLQMTEGTGPWSDIDGDGGTAAALGQVLVIRHHDAAHERIARLLSGR